MLKETSDSVQRVFSSAPWEKQVGYCRAIRSGTRIAVTGTVALAEDARGIHAPGDAYAQAKRSLELIERALRKLGTDRHSIVRTRMFVTDISRWQEFGRAHGEFFAECPPATSMLEISKLIDPAAMIEIEADAELQNTNS